ncbi:MAG TPA: hypothetical protein VFF22_08965 [Pseudomonas sp.]|nr:hypothetical protein [Pseudomonas sp.]
MIIVVEGVSAAGKTTWASRHSPAVVSELTGHPPDTDNVTALGQYWSDRHSERWQHGLALEHVHKVVCFDTDPLKIHYAWCLWQIGKDSRAAWMADVEASRERVAQKRLGFADQIVFLEPPEEVVRQQKANDKVRRRSNFETHVRLYEPLRRWYMLLETLSPGRVVFNAHQAPDSTSMTLQADRYSLQLFDALIDAADQPPK